MLTVMIMRNWLKCFFLLQMLRIRKQQQAIAKVQFNLFTLLQKHLKIFCPIGFPWRTHALWSSLNLKCSLSKWKVANREKSIWPKLIGHFYYKYYSIRQLLCLRCNWVHWNECLWKQTLKFSTAWENEITTGNSVACPVMSSLYICVYFVHPVLSCHSPSRIWSSTRLATAGWWGSSGCSSSPITAPSCAWKLWRWPCLLSKEHLMSTFMKRSIASSLRPQGKSSSSKSSIILFITKCH